MKDHFNRFAMRFICVLGLGLAALLLHGTGGAASVFAPRYAAPWELSKLAYWPILITMLATCRFSGGLKNTLLSSAPALTLAPLALMAALWCTSPLEPAAGICLLAWVVAAAVGVAAADQERLRGSYWLVLAAALAAAYVVFSFFPPAFGPFLDPSDAAAMATIPC